MALPLHFGIYALLVVMQLMFGTTMGDPQEACSRTLHVDLCLQSLLAYPDSRTADNHQLTALALSNAANYGVETTSQIQGALFDVGEHSSEKLEECLQECSEHITEAVEQLDTSTAAVSSKAYHDLNKLIGHAMEDAKACNDSCKDAIGKDEEADEVKKRTDRFLDLCTVAQDLSKLIDE